MKEKTQMANNLPQSFNLSREIQYKKNNEILHTYEILEKNVKQWEHQMLEKIWRNENVPMPLVTV